MYIGLRGSGVWGTEGEVRCGEERGEANATRRAGEGGEGELGKGWTDNFHMKTGRVSFLQYPPTSAPPQPA